MTPAKAAIIQSVTNHSAELISISDKIWAAEEVAFHESESAKLLADYAEANGFTVERGVAEMPTAFVATYGSGSPVIGILGEFDALPGLSQKNRGMSIGHRGLLHTSKTLAMTMADIMQDPKKIEEIKAEFKKRKGDHVYKGLVPDGPPPLGN